MNGFSAERRSDEFQQLLPDCQASGSSFQDGSGSSPQGDSKAVMGYRPSVDGLRAIAVISVIIYHMDKQWLPGGFVGVDIFFVISGYVVTGSLLSHSCSSVSDFLCGFYARRVKRLTPALVVVVTVTGLFIAILTPPGLRTSTTSNWDSQAKEYFSSGMYALCGLANLFFGWISLQGDGGYWNMTGKDRIAANPFVHTWSLGVEEQFYLLFPLLVMTVHGRRVVGSAPHRPAPPTSVVVFGVCAVLSGLVSWVMTRRASSLAFYALPARFWELAAGAMVADVELSGRSFSSSSSSAWKSAGLVILQIVAVLLIGASLWFVTPDATGFPFPGAVFPVAGAVCFIIVAACENIWLNRILGCALPVYVGKLSYPLYLWHWPVLTLTRNMEVAGLSTVSSFVRNLVLIFIMFVLASLTYHLIEEGFKTWRPKRHWHVFVAFLPAVLFSAMLLHLLQGPLYGTLFVSRVPPPPQELRTVDSMVHVKLGSARFHTPSVQLPANGCACTPDKRILVQPPKATGGKLDQPACLDLSGGVGASASDPEHICFEVLRVGDDSTADEQHNLQTHQEEIRKCLTPIDSPERKRTIFLLGDSHSRQAYPGLSTAVRGKFQIRHVALMNILASFLPRLRDMLPVQVFPSKRTRDSVQKMVDGFLEPGDVIVWAMYTSLPEVKDDPDFIAEYISFIREVGASAAFKNASLVVFGDNHGFEIHHGTEGTDPHSCAAGGLMSKELRGRCFPAREAWGNSSLVEAVRKAQRGSDWLLFEAAPPFCYRDRCGPFIPGTDVMAYNDMHHLGEEGSYFLAPFICAFFHEHGLFWS